MQKYEIANLFKKIVQFYPVFGGGDRDQVMEKINAWHEVLADISFEQASANLKSYVNDPENRYPPHPGNLAKAVSKSEAERYHESMKASGELTLQQLQHMKKSAVAPTAEQKRKVRELYGKN